MGNVKKLAHDIGKSAVYVQRALQYNSETAPAEVAIRKLAMEQYGGRVVAIKSVAYALG